MVLVMTIKEEMNGANIKNQEWEYWESGMIRKSIRDKEDWIELNDDIRGKKLQNLF